MARALDSDDDRPIGELTESDVEMMRRIFPDRRDPRVHEFNDLAHSDQAFAEGRDDELLEAPEASPNMVIENGRVFCIEEVVAGICSDTKETLQGLAFICGAPLHSCV